MNSTWPLTLAWLGPSYFTAAPISLPIATAPLPPDSKKPTPVSLGMNAILAPSAEAAPLNKLNDAAIAEAAKILITVDVDDIAYLLLETFRLNCTYVSHYIYTASP